jgi:hypothetical protein
MAAFISIGRNKRYRADTPNCREQFYKLLSKEIWPARLIEECSDSCNPDIPSVRTGREIGCVTRLQGCQALGVVCVSNRRQDAASSFDRYRRSAPIALDREKLADNAVRFSD